MSAPRTSTRQCRRPQRNSADVVVEALRNATTARIGLGMLSALKRNAGVCGTDADDEGSARWIDAAVRSLQDRLGAAFDPALIRTEVEAAFARFASAPIREFVPILVEHEVQARLALGSGGRAQPGADG